jgi:hypothetical protein
MEFIKNVVCGFVALIICVVIIGLVVGVCEGVKALFNAYPDFFFGGFFISAVIGFCHYAGKAWREK